MYLVEKGFANGTISASKGKVVEIKDKELASSLLEAGYIIPFSKKDMSNKEKDDEIKSLTTSLEKKDEEIKSLKDKISELETKNENLSTEIEELKKSKVESSNDKFNSNEQKDNLDNNSSTSNEDDKNNGDEQKDNLDNNSSTSNEDDKNNGGEQKKQELLIDGKDKNKKE